MKIFNIILAILFLLFAAVQFNDSPDDILFWVLVYAGVGIISAFAAFNKYNMGHPSRSCGGRLRDVPQIPNVCTLGLRWYAQHR
ncbi:MAG: hypothetical protein IPP25_18460 [Saprospiraceae bacterium]|nr:hypothetical protein [Candidatus Opimibacter skivensis]